LYYTIIIMIQTQCKLVPLSELISDQSI